MNSGNINFVNSKQIYLSPNFILGSVEMMEYLIDNFGRDLSVNQNDMNGYNCLHKAVTRGDVNMIRFLIRKGVNVNVFAGKYTTRDNFILEE